MNRKYVFPVILAAGALAVTSCQENEQATVSFTAFQSGASYTLENSAAEFSQDSDLMYVDSVSLLMPEKLMGCDVAELRDSIMSIAFDTTGVTIEEAAERWFDTCAQSSGWTAKRVAVTTEDSGIFGGFTYTYGYVVNLSPELLVYCVQTDSYAPGAAHGMSGHSYLNFSFEGKGTIVTLDKIFTPEGLKALPDRIAEQAEALSDRIGTTQVSDLPAGGNFYISSEGEIVFSYQPYEIASYAQGTIDIPFYPYELVDYMTPYGVGLFHLEDI